MENIQMSLFQNLKKWKIRKRFLNLKSMSVFFWSRVNFIFFFLITLLENKLLCWANASSKCSEMIRLRKEWTTTRLKMDIQKWFVIPRKMIKINKLMWLILESFLKVCLENDMKSYSWSPLLYLCAIWYILTLRASMFGTEYAANLRINSELELIWVIPIAVLITVWILGQIWIWGCWSIISA